MLKKCKVVMLPTNQKANIGNFIISKYDHNNHLVCGIKKGEPYNMVETRQYLYILSDEEQQVGDFGLLKGTDKVSIRTPDCGKADDFQKVIASTDQSLNLPEPSQAFIEKYVDLYNKGQQIKEVNVEYELVGHSTTLGIENWEPKVSSDNTITIRKIKDSYTRDEVVLLFDLFNYDLHTEYNVDCPYSVIEHWLKENL